MLCDLSLGFILADKEAMKQVRQITFHLYAGILLQMGLFAVLHALLHVEVFDNLCPWMPESSKTSLNETKRRCSNKILKNINMHKRE